MWLFCSTNEAWKKAQEALAATQTKPATESTSSNSSNISAAAAAVSAGNVQSFLQAGPLPQMGQGAPPPGWMPHPNPAFPKYVHLCIYLTSASIHTGRNLVILWVFCLNKIYTYTGSGREEVKVIKFLVIFTTLSKKSIDTCIIFCIFQLLVFS